jgi:hypothetical protein
MASVGFSSLQYVPLDRLGSFERGQVNLTVKFIHKLAHCRYTRARIYTMVLRCLQLRSTQSAVTTVGNGESDSAVTVRGIVCEFRCLIGSSIPRGKAMYPTWQYTKLVSVNCSLNDDPVLSHGLETSKRACHARLEKMKAGVPASHARKRPILGLEAGAALRLWRSGRARQARLKT